jgi:hypothetical protein
MISPERLFEAWYEFRKGKGNRCDVQEFGRHAEKHIFRLHRDLASGAYRHSPYELILRQINSDKGADDDLD